MTSQTTTKTTAPTTTTIWGPSQRVLAICRTRGATPVTTHYNDGQVVTSPAISFEGGYDDYEGSLSYAEIPGDFPGTPTRFSPRPGSWLSGIRLTPGVHGDLHDYRTGLFLRPATAIESDLSRRVGDTGVILVDGISCYVSR